MSEFERAKEMLRSWVQPIGTRETADHIAAPTTRADHAELARLAEAAYDAIVAPGERAHRLRTAFIAAASPATVLALLSEIAALRVEGEIRLGAIAARDALLEVAHTRLTQAERQRDEAAGLLREACRELEEMGDGFDVSDRINAFLANQGAEPAPVKKERAWICPQDNMPCPPECDSDDRRHCASVACKEQPE